jgi:site-specific DNA recombinase
MAKRRRVAAATDGTKAYDRSVRVATYRRISTDEVNQPYSLEAQLVGLEAFVASQPGWVLTHGFVDQASGATLARPGLEAALAAAAAGAYDVLLVYRIDRLTRSIVGMMTIVAALDERGVALKSVTEPIDTQSPVGRLLLQLLAIFAEFERSLLIDRITSGFKRKAARGEWLGGPAPYGYALDPPRKSLVPLEPEASVVQEIFAKYTVEMLGAMTIACWLNETGRRFRGSEWTFKTVLRIVRNAVYDGKITHAGVIHQGQHEAILGEGVFAAAQARLGTEEEEEEDEEDGERPPTPNRSEYLLSGSGLLRCTSCGRTYSGTGAYGRNKTLYRYYTCCTRVERGAAACPSKRLPAEVLEQLVIGAVLELYADLDLFEEAAAIAIEANCADRPRIEEELAATKAQLGEITVTIDRYLHAFEAGTMSDTLCGPRVEELSSQRNELDAHRERLARRLREQPAEPPRRPELESLRDEMRDAFRDARPEVAKQALASLVDRIEVSPDGVVQPFFRVPGGATPTRSRRSTRTPVRIQSSQVELTGFEPATYWLQTSRSAN